MRGLGGGYQAGAAVGEAGGSRRGRRGRGRADGRLHWQSGRCWDRGRSLHRSWSPVAPSVGRCHIQHQPRGRVRELSGRGIGPARQGSRACNAQIGLTAAGKPGASLRRFSVTGHGQGSFVLGWVPTASRRAAKSWRSRARAVSSRTRNRGWPISFSRLSIAAKVVRQWGSNTSRRCFPLWVR